MSNDLPFGNSIYQIQHFIANEPTPGRARRKILLQISQKIAALKEAEFGKRRKELDKLELLEKLQKAKGIKKERYTIDLEEIEFSLLQTEKLRQDCLYELEYYNYLLSKLPDYNREAFEKEEQEYWGKRLSLDAKLEILQMGKIQADTLKSLVDIGFVVKQDGNKVMIDKKEEDGGPLTDELPLTN